VGGAEACSGFRVEVLGCRVMATQGDLTHNRQFESGRARACLASEVERRGGGGGFLSDETVKTRLAVCYRVLQCVAVCCSVQTLRLQRPPWTFLLASSLSSCSAVQCAAVCYSILQCVAVCCSVLVRLCPLASVLQCVAVCCSVLQCVAVCCSVLQCVAVCCSGLQWVAVGCSVLLCVAVCCCVVVLLQTFPMWS